MINEIKTESRHEKIEIGKIERMKNKDSVKL